MKFDEPADISTDDSLHRIYREDEHFGGSGFLGNHGGTEPDVDWFQVDLHSDYEYHIEVWTDTSYLEKHQATQLKILGIRDKDGNAIDDTSSPTSGKNVSVDFQPTTTGEYHLSVGSDGTDHTGVYSIRVTSVLTGEEKREKIRAPAPQNLEAEANSDGSTVCAEAFGVAGIDPEEIDDGSVVCLTWDAPDDDSVESYQILRHRPSEGESTSMILLEDTVSLETTFIDANVSPGILHVYYVKAINYAGISEKSNKAEVTPLASAQAAGTVANTLAAGAPTISGTALAGETLTADVSRIEDEDGISSATFIYQWIRTDGGADAEIPDAVNSTYMVTDEDVGKPIKVRVTFTDDAGNEESLTSTAVVATVTRTDQLPAAPGISSVSPEGTGALKVSWKETPDDGGPPVTGYLLQWKEAAGNWETAADVSEETVTGTTHTITGLTGGVEYAVRVIAISEAGSSPASEEAFGTPRDITPPQLSTATVDGTTLTLTYDEALAGDSVPGTDTFRVMAGSDERGVARVSMAGAIVIVTLDSAVTAGDAVTVGYAAPANESAPRITDEAGNHGASFDKQAVTNLTPGEEPPQRPRKLTGVANEDGSVTLTWDDPGDGTITGYQILRRRPTEGEGALLVYVEDMGSAATTFTDAKVSAGIRHVYRVKAINTAGLSRMSNKVNVTPLEPQESPSNTAATGAPVIGGTPRVGETLTADTSGIEDEDGLDSVSYSHQWLADGADIAGATAGTYTLTADDEGQAIRVRVSFTDDAGNDETLTSEATDAVSAAEPTELPAKPTGLSATASHDSVTLTWDDPQDDSITGYVILRRVRENDTGGEFSVLVPDTGSASTTYTDDTVVAETTYTYRIKAINEHGVSERSRWFHIDIPAAPVPDKPTGLSATATHDSVTLTWNDPGDDSITGYVILRRHRYDDPKGHFDELVADTGTADTTYADDTVAAGTSYTYRIKAINGAGPGERSRWSHIDTPAAP